MGNTNNISQITDRIRQLMDFFGDDVAKFSRRIRVKYPALQPVLGKRHTKPSAELLQAIALNTDADLKWLLTGQGTMFKEEILEQEISTATAARLSVLEQKMLKLLPDGTEPLPDKEPTLNPHPHKERTK